MIIKWNWCLKCSGSNYYNNNNRFCYALSLCETHAEHVIVWGYHKVTRAPPLRTHKAWIIHRRNRHTGSSMNKNWLSSMDRNDESRRWQEHSRHATSGAGTDTEVPHPHCCLSFCPYPYLPFVVHVFLAQALKERFLWRWVSDNHGFINIITIRVELWLMGGGRWQQIPIIFMRWVLLAKTVNNKTPLLRGIS